MHIVLHNVHIDRLEITLEDHAPSGTGFDIGTLLRTPQADEGTPQPLRMRVADSEENRTNTFWRQYIGAEVSVTKEEPLEDGGVMVSGFIDGDPEQSIGPNPFGGVLKSRFQDL